MNLGEGLLRIGHDREGTAPARNHHHPRALRRVQQGKERVGNPDRSVDVGVVNSVDLLSRRLRRRSAAAGRARIVYQDIEPIGVFSNVPTASVTD